MMLPAPSEWIVIFVAILIIFGPKKLPQLGNALGEAIRQFKKGIDGIDATPSNQNQENSEIKENPTSKLS